jgi:hypothetical protein
MFQQSILEGLQNIFGEGLTWEGLGGLSSEDISEGFATEYDVDFGDMPASMFQQLSPEMLEGASWKTYAPQIQAKGQSLLSGLYKGLGGAGAQKAAGGFAGSGGFQKQQTGARDVYGKSMSEALGSAMGQRSQGIGNISDVISQWHQMAQQIKGL